MGNNVRYDGGNKLDAYLIDILGKYADFVPVCPEVECGLSVPRDSMRLHGNPAAPRLVVIATGEDLTEKLSAWALRKVLELEKEGLSGFVLKSRSPSCALRSVEVLGQDGISYGAGTGVFARALIEKFPSLPVEEETCLQDPEALKYFSGYLLKGYRGASG